MSLGPEIWRVKLAKLIKEADLSPSVSEAKRLIKQGAVHLDGERITDPEFVIVVCEAP